MSRSHALKGIVKINECKLSKHLGGNAVTTLKPSSPVIQKTAFCGLVLDLAEVSSLVSAQVSKSSGMV